METKKRRLLIGFVLAALVVAQACQSTNPAATTGSDTLIVGMPATPPNVDLDQSSAPAVWLVAGQTMARGLQYQRVSYPYPTVAGADPTKIRGFTYPNFDLSTLQPGILSSCDLSSDGLTATYHLRQRVMSAAGHEFTSADVIWNVQRSIALKQIGAIFLGFAGASDLNQWSAVDKYTVRITGTTPMPGICVYNAHLYFKYLDSTEAKKHTTASDPWATTWEATHAAGFGPYQITDWEAGKQIVMASNPNYYAGAPSIKKIIFQVIPDDAGRVSLLQAGKIQIAETLSPDEYLALEGKSGVAVAAEASPQELFFDVNNSKPPFNNVMVRRALNMAMPRSDVVNSIYHGLATAWQGPTPSVFTTAGYKERHDYDQNTAQAKQLLSQAGYPNGFTTTLTYSAADPVQEQIAILLQNSLKSIGVTLDLQKLPAAAYSDLVLNGKADFALWIDAPFNPEPAFVTGIFTTFGNFDNYNNSAVKDAMAKGSSVVGVSKRNTYFGTIQDTVYQDSPLVWIAEPDSIAAMSTKVHGFGLDCFSFYDVFRMSLS